MEYAYSNWYHEFTQAYSTRLYHSCTFDTTNIVEVATALDIDDYGVGMYNGADIRAIQFTSCFAGGTVKNVKGSRGNAPGSNDHNIEFLYCKGQTLTNVQGGITQYARSTGLGIAVNYCSDLTLNNCRIINSRLALVASLRIRINDLDICDRCIGYTNTGALYSVSVGAGCDDILVDGVTYGIDGTIPNVHSFSGAFYSLGASNVIFRNLGTKAAPISGGTWRPNYYGAAYIFTSGGNNNTLKLQRCYMDLNRTAPFNTINSDKNVILESIYGGKLVYSAMANFALANAFLNADLKAVSVGLNSVTGQVSVYGTHFEDVFLGDTMGRFILLCNEPTVETASQFTMVVGTAKWNSAGGIYLPNVNDQAIWEDSCFRKGHTGFANVTPTMSGGTAARFTVEYAIDTGAGYGAWTVATGANLSAEVVDPSVGFRMKLRITRISASSSGAITYYRIDTISTAAAQNNQYDLDPVNLTFTALDAVTKAPIAGARVYLATSPGGVELVNDVTDASGELTVVYPYTADQAVTGRVRKSTGVPYYKTGDMIGTITDEGFSATVLMISDE
jgi:hypothetical protein